MAIAPRANFPGGPNSLQELTFPPELPDYKYHITFDFRQFRRRSLEDRVFWAATGGVRLPVPSNLNDTEQEKWGVQEAGPVLGAVMEGAAKVQERLSVVDPQQLQNQITSFLSGDLAALQAIGESLGITGSNLSAFGSALALQAASTLGGTATSAYSSIFGKSVNPFHVVLYQCPVYKRHSFFWTLSPRDEQESIIIKNIIAKFRYHMKSDFTKGIPGGLILDYPDICYVTLYPRDEFLYKFKPCVVESFQANYARQSPMGPSFYRRTNAPSEVMITVNLLEIEYWVKEDVQDSWNWSSVEDLLEL